MSIVPDDILAALTDDERKIVELHATGLSLERVGRELHIGKQRVSRLVHRLGLARHTSKSAADRPPVATPEQVDDVLRLYGAGASYYSVAMDTGISASQCRRIVAYYNPGIARTREQQQQLQGQPHGHDFRLSHLGLRRHGHSCAGCGMEFLVPIDVPNAKGRECGLCAYFHRRAA